MYALVAYYPGSRNIRHISIHLTESRLLQYLENPLVALRLRCGDENLFVIPDGGGMWGGNGTDEHPIAVFGPGSIFSQDLETVPLAEWLARRRGDQ